MATGYIGPRRIPMKEIAMALPTREGVNHIIISKLLDLGGKVSSHGRIESETYPITRSV